MRWFKFSIIFLLLILGVYTASMYIFVKKNSTIKVERDINYGIDKVYPQFNNLQKFSRWNSFFSESKTFFTEYYQPYEGNGSSMSFSDDSHSGELQISYENPLRTLKYQLYQDKNATPTNITVKFLPVSTEKTKIIWTVFTPEKSVLERYSNLWSDSDFVEIVDKSMTNLKTVLSNKIDKEELLKDIKFDSLMVENLNEQLLLGVNVTTSNKSDALYKNILLNYSKVTNFITNDLNKKEDEFGFPVLITTATNFKDKELSYYLGFPLSKKVTITDNNFNFKEIKASKAFTIYYKGNYANRVRAIQTLLQKAKSESLDYSEMQQVFLETPTADRDVLMKFSLPLR
ncbi:SRPBCC family protein [Frigoriflavimonas asaccharolytica]|uniref:Effector-binding domain-containing protein n=1 Tax=Frigoriflavimonas asaccharolytica TaxID=2735899 RepID=A0A8J8GBP7_9FLAO|nr:polyketide cyclase [Frigoriflavimonas asaccharolytica]NRS92752.1 effector-binding domain-containing protein [Frigoriflavimonas asaccharolytica]